MVGTGPCCWKNVRRKKLSRFGWILFITELSSPSDTISVQLHRLFLRAPSRGVRLIANLLYFQRKLTLFIQGCSVE